MPLSRFSCIRRGNEWLKKKLMWNFVIRLILEGALETAFCCYINIKYGKFDRKIFGSVFSFLSSIVLGLLLILFPVFILVFYLRNFDRLGDQEFLHKYGGVYEGLKTNKKSVLAYPVYFVIRRISFMAISLLLY